MYPEDAAEVVWKRGRVKFAIVRKSLPFVGEFYCGYCIFPKRFLAEKGYGGIVTYVPVHGGITYAEERKDGNMVYGFDCAHAGDENIPELKDIEWLKRECEIMAKSLNIAKKYEKRYLTATNDKEREEIIDEFLKEVMKRGGTRGTYT